MTAHIDENLEYWNDFNNLQRKKHELLQRYLGRWFPILGSWSGRIVYVDCNAGRGRHSTGEPGSRQVRVTGVVMEGEHINGERMERLGG